jgi:hypothetical protein
VCDEKRRDRVNSQLGKRLAHQYRFGPFFLKGQLGCCAFEQPVRYNDLYARECDIWWSLSETAAQS